MFWFSLGVTSINVADEGNNIILDVVLALEVVYFESILERGAKEGECTCRADDVFDHCMLSCDYEVAMLEEGQSLDNPIFGLFFLIIFPLLRRKELIAIRYVEVLTEKTADLRLRSNSKIPDYHAFIRELGIHDQQTTIQRLFLKNY